jgi:hypothetical protein
VAPLVFALIAMLVASCVDTTIVPPSSLVGLPSPSVAHLSPSTAARSPSASGSAIRSSLAPPSPTDEPTPSAAGRQVIVKIPSRFGDLRVRIDSNGLVTAGRAATDAEVGRMDLGERDIGVLNLADDRLLVFWEGTICERSARLIVVPAEVFLAPDPRKGCDAVGFGWGLVLTTRDPVDASRMLARQGRTVLLP